LARAFDEAVEPTEARTQQRPRHHGRAYASDEDGDGPCGEGIDVPLVACTGGFSAVKRRKQVVTVPEYLLRVKRRKQVVTVPEYLLRTRGWTHTLMGKVQRHTVSHTRFGEYGHGDVAHVPPDSHKRLSGLAGRA
jgi:hypothetical protein